MQRLLHRPGGSGRCLDVRLLQKGRKNGSCPYGGPFGGVGHEKAREVVSIDLGQCAAAPDAAPSCPVSALAVSSNRSALTEDAASSALPDLKGLEMLDTANTYDDKVAIIRMIVSDEAGRVSNVFKQMMKKDLDLVG